MARLRVSTPPNSSIGALRYIADKYSLTVDYGYPTGEMKGGWTPDSTEWIYSGKEDWTEVIADLTTPPLTFSSEETI
jgi:hypothetical protein